MKVYTTEYGNDCSHGDNTLCNVITSTRQLAIDGAIKRAEAVAEDIIADGDECTIVTEDDSVILLGYDGEPQDWWHITEHEVRDS